MAFVIVSTGPITGSRLHTLRISRLLLGLGGIVLLALAVGVQLGYRFGQTDVTARATDSRTALPSLSEYIERPEGRALVERIGALSGRVIQLETEARALASRIGILQQSGVQAGRNDALQAPAAQESALAQAAGPAGGPFVPVFAEGQLAPMVPAQGGASGLVRLERDVEQLSATLQLLANATTPRELEGMAFPSRLPISGRRITSGFGLRIDPFTRRRARHTGIDIAAPRNTPIQAAGGGRVVFAGYRAAYGNTVEIDHGNGLSTRYAHASRLLVRRGDIVLPEQPIAIVGSTGRSTGPHVHFEVLRNGKAVEPRGFLHHTGA